MPNNNIERLLMTMKITKVSTINTGGGCMVSYIDVENMAEVTQISLDEGVICARSKRYQELTDQEDPSDTCVWAVSTEEEMRGFLSEGETVEVLQVLFSYCLRFKMQPDFLLSPGQLTRYRLLYVARVVDHDVESKQDGQMAEFLLGMLESEQLHIKLTNFKPKSSTVPTEMVVVNAVARHVLDTLIEELLEDYF